MNSERMSKIVEHLIPFEVKRFEDEYGNVLQIERKYTDFILKDIKKDGTSNIMVFFDKAVSAAGYIVLLKDKHIVGGIFAEEFEVI